MMYARSTTTHLIEYVERAFLHWSSTLSIDVDARYGARSHASRKRPARVRAISNGTTEPPRHRMVRTSGAARSRCCYHGVPTVDVLSRTVECHRVPCSSLTT